MMLTLSLELFISTCLYVTDAKIFSPNVFTVRKSKIINEMKRGKIADMFANCFFSEEYRLLGCGAV
jgi:hypothetical protein